MTTNTGPILEKLRRLASWIGKLLLSTVTNYQTKYNIAYASWNTFYKLKKRTWNK